MSKNKPPRSIGWALPLGLPSLLQPGVAAEDALLGSLHPAHAAAAAVVQHRALQGFGLLAVGAARPAAHQKLLLCGVQAGRARGRRRGYGHCQQGRRVLRLAARWLLCGLWKLPGEKCVFMKVRRGFGCFWEFSSSYLVFVLLVGLRLNRLDNSCVWWFNIYQTPNCTNITVPKRQALFNRRPRNGITHRCEIINHLESMDIFILLKTN